MKGKILLMVGAAMLLVGLLPAMSAFEAHLINATARVVQPGDPFGKTFAAAAPQAICVDINPADTIPNGVCQPGVEGSPDYWMYYEPAAAFPLVTNPSGIVPPIVPDDYNHGIVAVGVVACWDFLITVTNTYGYVMDEVVITDHFGAEFIDAGTSLEDAVAVTRVYHSPKGRSKKDPVQSDPFTTQVRITWYPDYNDPSDPDVVPLDPMYSTLGLGQSETLTVTVCTKRNPAGNQEYTSPGNYDMNSGAVLKWKNEAGQQFSETTGSLGVTAVQVTSITVTPANAPNFHVFGTLQYTATANAGPYSFNWNSLVTWSSSTSAATISVLGIATGVNPGTTNITGNKLATASSPGVVSSNTATLTVTP